MGKRKSKATNLDTKCVNTLRFLAIDAIEKANSGHPGICLESAPLFYVLSTRKMQHNPANPQWPSRDRLIFSAGHGTPLLYGDRALCGYFPLEELQKLRQWGSLTPGHPEYGFTPGVETTTGPLGQGFGNAVGIAMAEQFLAAYFNQPEFPIIDFHTFCIVGDGCLMEGISQEAASLAGHQKLGKLIVFKLDNRITIEGDTNITFSDNEAAKFRAMGWQVIRVKDGNNLDSIDTAIEKAKADTDRPSLIMLKTHIGYGSPRQDSAKAHGEPLGTDNARVTKEKLDWPLTPEFHVPQEVLKYYKSATSTGARFEQIWQDIFTTYESKYPKLAEQFTRLQRGELPNAWYYLTRKEVQLPADRTQISTREASGIFQNTLFHQTDILSLTGSADLGPSCKNIIEGWPYFLSDRRDTCNIHYGVREHAMGAIMNGLALMGFIPVGSTFLTFADYMKPAIRLAAMMKLKVIYVFTHDSIGVGEDGPTHQPIEQLAMLRGIPGLTVIRPCDAEETFEAWHVAVENNGPTALSLTRQNVPIINRLPHKGFKNSAAELHKGAYILWESFTDDDQPDFIMIATGSEVAPTIEAAKQLDTEQQIKVRVISMPSWELFEQQSKEYKELVLPPNVKMRLAVEAGIPQGWHKYVGDSGAIISIDRFGASAPGPVLFDKFGFTVDNIVNTAMNLLEEQKIQAIKDFRLG